MLELTGHVLVHEQDVQSVSPPFGAKLGQRAQEEQVMRLASKRSLGSPMVRRALASFTFQ
jgi:hypothetical protein